MLRPLGTIKGDSTEMKRILIQIAAIAVNAFLLSLAAGCGDSARHHRPTPAKPERCSTAPSRPGEMESRPTPSRAKSRRLKPPTTSGRTVSTWSSTRSRTIDLPAGTGQSFRVTLWLKDDRAKQTKVITQYDVTTSPLRVVRAGF